MKGSIMVHFTGITKEDLLKALQSLRDVEQRDPEHIHMMMLVRAEELSTAEVSEMLNQVKPPLPEQVFLRKGVSIVETMRRSGPGTSRI